MIKNIKVAIYCRVSTEEQKKFGISIDDQKNSLIRYCKQNNYVVYDIYMDEGVSASTISKRKEFVRLLKELDNFDLIIFTKLDRFSRNVKDANDLLVILNEHNVEFRAIDEEDIDTSTADGRFIFNLKVNLAEHERNKDSERINRVNNYKYKVAKTVCTGAKIFGYDIDKNKHLVINEKEAEEVRNLYEYYLATNSLIKTIRWFRENVAPKSASQIRNYLRDQKYIGIYVTTRTKETLKDFCPRILDDELFYAVQKKLKINIKEYTQYKSDEKREYIFSGLIVCGKCGYKMSGGTQGKKRGYKKMYRCKQHFVERRCDNQYSTTEESIEKYLKEHILEAIETYVLEVEEKKKKNIVNKSNELKIKLNKLTDLYLQDLIQKDKYEQDYRKYEAEYIKAKQEEKEQVVIKDTSKLKKFIDEDFMQLYDTLTDIEKQKFWRNTIEKIKISGKNQIEIII